MHRVDGRVRPMTPAEPDTLDKPWRLWASVAIISVLAVLGRVRLPDLPVVQGRAAGIDAFTAICRAVGIAAGSPAAPQPTEQRPGGARHRGRLEHATCSATCPAGPSRRHGRSGCVGCHGERGIARRSAEPEPRRPVRRRDLQAAPRLQERQARPRGHGPDRASLEEQQIVDVAAYFAASNRLSLDPTTAEVPDPDINRLVERGDPARKPARLQLVPRLQRRRSDRDADPVAPEQGVSRPPAARVQGRRAGGTTSTRGCGAWPKS